MFFPALARISLSRRALSSSAINSPTHSQRRKIPQCICIMDEATDQKLVPALHPQVTHGPSLEYVEFMRVRQKILDIVRADTPEKIRVVDDVADALLKSDTSLPTDLLSGALAIFGLGRKIYELRRRREIYKKVINAILEQIFDPGIEFKMTKRDILDVFEAYGMERDKVSPQQVSLIYVKVIHKLRVGELRDLTWEEQMHKYVSLKLREIYYSRQDWELNGR